MYVRIYIYTYVYVNIYIYIYICTYIIHYHTSCTFMNPQSKRSFSAFWILLVVAYHDCRAQNTAPTTPFHVPTGQPRNWIQMDGVPFHSARKLSGRIRRIQHSIANFAMPVTQKKLPGSNHNWRHAGPLKIILNPQDPTWLMLSTNIATPCNTESPATPFNLMRSEAVLALAPWQLLASVFRAALPQAAKGITGCFAMKWQWDSRGPPFCP